MTEFPLRPVSSVGAPPAIGPYSQAIVHDGLVYASGQVGISPEGVRAEGIVGETHQALVNLSAVLEAADPAHLEELLNSRHREQRTEKQQQLNQLQSAFAGRNGAVSRAGNPQASPYEGTSA